MRVEDFFEEGIANSLKSTGVQEMVPLETSVDALLATFDGKGYRIVDPLAYSNTRRPFVHEGVGRYAVMRDPIDPELELDEVLMIATKVDDTGVEGLPHVFDRDLDKLGRFVFE